MCVKYIVTKAIADHIRANKLLFSLLTLALFVDLAWHHYVGFIRDDAFITFRYAKNITNGLGFVYNPGEHVYGTSSPGFALLMAVWLFLFPAQPVAGAIFFDIVASLLSLYLVWKLLEDLTDLQRSLILITLIFPSTLLSYSLEGMETPLVITCMLASFYFLSRDRSIAGGICAGLMLWVRMDSALWIAALAVICFFQWRRNLALFLLATVLTYLPWLVFAQVYFGSMIPLTAIAKRVAFFYAPQPLRERLNFFLSWPVPFTNIDPVWSKVIAMMIYIVACIGAWKHRWSAFVLVSVVFLIIQSIALTAMGMTIGQRYFITSLCILLVLFAIGVFFWVRSRRLGWVLLGLCLVGSSVYLSKDLHTSLTQKYVNEGSLIPMGMWIKNNTPEDSTIFLEPLGYVGYYAERKMVDEVAIVSPVVLPFKRAKANTYDIISALKPDYVILHCDDAGRAPETFNSMYEITVRFDPMGFMDGKKVSQTQKGAQRLACYQIHKIHYTP